MTSTLLPPGWHINSIPAQGWHIILFLSITPDLVTYLENIPPIHSHRRLNPEEFRVGLLNHPDRAFADKIVHQCANGVDLGYTGPRVSHIHPNWPSAYEHYGAVQASITKDISYGTKVGPFSEVPFPDQFVGSPMGAFSKRSGKVRVIHDLSWPPTSSVNDFIDPDEYRVEYMSIDDVVEHVKLLGPSCYIAKLDLADAFKHVPVRPEDWPLLGSSWYVYNKDTNMYDLQYYFDRVLMFGGRSSPRLFNDIAKAAAFIMQQHGVTYCDQYLDDFVTAATSSEQCDDNLATMLQTCADLGFSVNPQKVHPASTCLEFLGIVIDTTNMELRISEERLSSVMDELEQWRGKKQATKREVLSLIGKLIFISRVVRSGRTFVRHMIHLAKKVRQLHHKIKLNRAFQADINWWISFLPTWNGISIMYDHDWVTNVDLDLYTDASDKAVAGYFNGAWYVELVTDTNHSINWRELYAVVLAAATWSKQWAGKRVLFHCDNQAICHVLCSQTSRSPELMQLVRALFYIAASTPFEFSATYVNTKKNCVADALSRLDFARFWNLVPGADVCMTHPCVLDSHWLSVVD